jgi:2-dehydropantoate 2-reductase
MAISKRIGVIGAGPVGSIVAAHLARAGREVVLVESGGRLEQVRQHGLAIGGITEVAPQHPTLLAKVDDLSGLQLEALFICTKTWSLPTLLPVLTKVLDPNATIVSFQNGIGPEEEIAAVFDRARVCRGIVNFAGGVTNGGDQVAMQWFTPPNYIGPLEGNGCPSTDLATLMTEAGLATEVVSEHDVKKKVFWKTILNSALNALCASSGITMRQAMSLQHTRSLAQLLIREGLSVASAVGYYYGESSMDQCLHYLDRGGDHLPSMWVDLQRGLPTEIEYINGKIVQVGKMFRNVAVDVNIFFTSMIVTMEIKSGVRRPDQIPVYLTQV